MTSPDAPAPTDATPADQPWLSWRNAAVLLSLTGFAIAQPLLSVFGQNPALFNLYEVTGSDLALYAATVALAPPLLLWLVATGAALAHRGLGAGIHLGMVGVLAGLGVLQLVKWDLGVSQPAVLGVVTVLAGVATGYAYHRWQAVRVWLQFTSVLPLLALGTFLFGSDVSDLRTSPADDGETARLSPQPSDLPPVVFVLFDELPTKSVITEDARIDPVRFPNLAELGETATWYRHYTSLSGQTTVAVPSILTGRAPTLEPPVYANYRDNLFSLLAPTHDLTVFESPTGLCGLPQCSEGAPGAGVEAPATRLGDLFDLTTSVWRDRISLTDDRLERLDDFEEDFVLTPDPSDEADPDVPSGGGWSAADALAKPARMLQFTETFTARDTPALYFMHILLPHVPLRLYEDGRGYDVPLAPPERHPFATDNDEGPWVAAVTEQRHLLQAEYTDRLIGDLRADLEEVGIWDDALVIITADHGRSFESNTPGRRITEDSIDSIAYAPLLVKEPGQTEGRIDDANLMSYDILPTIADLVGIEVPWEVEGLAASDPLLDERGSAKVFYATEGLGTLRLRGIVEFDDRLEFPDAGDRWIGPVADGEPRLARLEETLPPPDHLGRRVDEFTITPGPSARVSPLALLRRPPTDRSPPGMAVGNIEDAASLEPVVIAVNGVIVAGSPIFDFMGVDDTFIALLPPGVLGAVNEIRMFQVDGADLVELALS